MADLTALEVNCDSIRKDIIECGRLYILVAYKVYELAFYGTYKAKYNNIVECCEKEFGFKKSTTYNLIGIVKKFGERDESGKITYFSITRYERFSYSQLSEMLSLSAPERATITPDTTVAEIKEMKKSKRLENSENVIEILPGQLELVENGQLVESKSSSDNVENSRRLENSLVKQQLELYNNDVEKTVLGLIERIKTVEYSKNHFQKLAYSYQEKIRKLEEKIKEYENEFY